MEYQGKIRGFGSYTPQQMKQMQTDLGFSMSESLLMHCAAYYRNHEKRDPYIDELGMLDLFAKEAQSSVLNIAPTELFTNNSFAAETYADMVKKRHQLLPNAKHPCTVSEAFSMADAYLARAGKSRLLSATYPMPRDRVLSSESGEENTVFSMGASSCLRMLTVSRAPKENGDLICLMLTAAADRQAMAKFLNDETATAFIKDTVTVDEGGVLGALQKLAQGLLIRPSRLSRTGDAVSLSMLVTAYRGTMLVRIAPQNYEAFYHAAATHGVFAHGFAAVTPDPYYCFECGNRPAFRINTAFLHSLQAPRCVTVNPDDEKSNGCSPIPHTPVVSAHHAYLCAKEQKPLGQTVAVKDTLFATAALQVGSNPMKHALAALLAPILTLAASGCDYPLQRLSLTLSLPQNAVTPTEYGDIFSVLLAIYRVQAELGIPSASSLLTQKQEQTRPSLDVFSSMQAAKAVGGQFTTAGNRLWCLAPAFDANGYPNFDSVRHLLTDLCAMARDGVIKSAYVLCGNSVTDGVKAMEQGTHLTCKLSGNAWLESSPLPLAILVETEKTIGASLIGTLTPAARQTATDLPVSIPSPSDRLIWSERPRVIVVAKPHDANAVMLTDALCKHGADALLVPDTESRVAPLSREILSAHVVILCHNAKPKTAPCMDFAWQTFAQAGGRIILLGNAKTQAPVPQIRLPNGFTPENLSQICQFER